MVGDVYSFPSALECRAKTIGVRDDMLELSFRLFVLYADLPDLPITANSKKNGADNCWINLGDQVVIYNEIMERSTEGSR